ncbi:phage/plasmid primase, P4 family [Methylobacterium bullatum]|uniref:SF3 helicase domain-containing protein n=1 Tax=Methylobacterium bullatum TaxID=570505 RepID=A0AAV4ZDQ8_9HYPH|nr:phage/plasmid primase, P4 family [Methylobacterium bullatum]GJD41952.1 hypothetical protein OICFNHDK_4438 [Methylobacterium bullatum]
MNAPLQSDLKSLTLYRLADSRRWVSWLTQDRNGKPTKVPYGVSGRPAKASDPTTWLTKQEAAAQAGKARGRQGGVGVQLGLHDQVLIGGIDLDSCRDATTGELLPWAAEIVRRFNSYSEVSPSNVGVKLFFLCRSSDLPAAQTMLGGKLGKSWSKGNHCEIALYLGGRYFAVTSEGINPQTFGSDPIGQFDDLRLIELSDLRWLIESAGPAFIGTSTSPVDTLFDVFPSSPAKSDHPAAKGDTSRSGRAYAVACEIRRHRGTVENFRSAIEKDADLAEWAKDDRQFKRTWDKSSGAVGEAFSFTEDGVARNFAALHGDRLRYCHTASKWLAWDGQRWRREETQLAFDWCRETCRAMLADDPKNRDAKSLSRASSASGVERFARADRVFAVESSVWDRDPWLLCTPGGTVELHTGVLRPGRQEDMLTKSTAVAPIPLDRFDAERDCPTWIRFLREALADDDGAIRFLAQWAGYSLTGDTREESLLFVHGPGGSGKSTAVNALGDIMGDYCTNVATETLSASKFDRHPEEIARLRGARMARASETEQGRAWAQQRITAMTGGDTLTARFMRQDSFEFKPEFKLTIIGNHRPAILDVDAAVKRRFNVLPFDHKPARPDDTLKARLRAEWPGILSWAILGCLDWQENGLVRPEVVMATTQAYFETQDTFQLWIDDCCEVGKLVASTTEELWNSWFNFAHRAGEDPGSKTKTFPDRLQQRGFTPVRNTAAVQGRGFKGITVKQGGRDALFD